MTKDTKYTHYHIPRAGRHGLLVSEKDVEGRCEYARNALDDSEAKGYKLAAVDREWFERVKHDDEGYCVCEPGSAGVVWKDVMSDIGPCDCSVDVDALSGSDPVDALEGSIFVSSIENSANLTLREEREMRNMIERKDASYSFGDVGFYS